MKTAEEVAEEAFAEIVGNVGMARIHSSQVIPAIVKAFNAYAEERVKDALDRDDREVFNSGRDEALEEAAKVAESHDDPTPCGVAIAGAIRALKGKAGK